MVLYSKFDKVMEAGNHAYCAQCKQSAASSKTRMSRGNFFKYLGIIAFAKKLTTNH